MLFMVWKRSGKMKKYRCYLMNSIVWCYGFHLSMFLLNMTPLFPSGCRLFEPLIPISSEALPFAFLLSRVCLINLDLSVVFSCVYRFSQAFPGRLSRLLDESKWIYAVIAGLHVFGYSLVLLPERKRLVESEREMRIQLENEDPQLLNLEKTVFLCASTTRNHSLVVPVVLAVFFLFGVFLCCSLRIQSRRMRSQSGVSSTYKMHEYLFVALLAQFTAGVVFLLLPEAFIPLFVYFEASCERLIDD
ncbi:hypothetical protein M3Y99_01793400 [Aphelenchoides fujianensis]|nr:hypothetical protein M3Y99_01793400 [Aphelenchoides fujianensis]